MADIIFLEGLEITCIIGIFDWERKKAQKVLIDLEFPANVRKAARTDSIRHAVDYKRIAKEAAFFAAASRFYLIEALAERLAQKLLGEFGLAWVRVRVSKPGAIRGSKNVGVEILRRRTGKKRTGHDLRG